MNEEQGVGWAQKPGLLGGDALILCQYWLNSRTRRLIGDYGAKAVWVENGLPVTSIIIGVILAL